MSTEYAVRFKDIIANMSETLTVKEVDEYCKFAKKIVNNEKKALKKMLPKKRVKKMKADEDGNDIVKVKKPLSKYLQFLQDNRQKVIEENPGLKSKEYMSLLANLWNKHKEDNKDSEDEDNKDSEDDSDIKVAVVDKNPWGLTNSGSPRVSIACFSEASLTCASRSEMYCG